MTTTPSKSSIGLSMLDRRISVAPIMEWTDEAEFDYWLNDLAAHKIAVAFT